MTDFSFSRPSASGGRLFLGGALLLLMFTGAGCGLLGSDGGDDSESEDFPEPPGRPSGAIMNVSQGLSEAPSTGTSSIASLRSLAD